MMVASWQLPERPAPFGGSGGAIPEPSSACRSSRVVLGGGALNTLLMDPSVLPFERVWRILPEEGMYDSGVSPARPYSVEIGAFKSQGSLELVLIDLRPDIYRLSGIDAGDYVPAEARRFNGCMGFDVLVDGRRSYTDMEFYLDPQSVPLQGTKAFQPDPGSSDLFSGLDTDEAHSFASASQAGTSLQPVRSRRPGSPSMPYSIYVRPNSTVQVRVVIFRPLPSPIAFIEYGLSGIYMPAQTLNALLACMRSIAEVPR